MESLLSRLSQNLGSSPDEDAPEQWRNWVYNFFPRYVSSFAPHHEQIWEWAWGIQKGVRPRPLIAILPRGSGKSTSAELIAACLGARRTRRYMLYVRSTQDQADKSVENIATLLESPIFASAYPAISRKRVNKYGQARGWRRSRLSAENGFTIDAYGLDTALRGTKVDEERPDLIFLDDIDEKEDSVKTSNRKIEAITTSILPAGSSDLAVFAIQNLIISHGFFAQIAYNQADFLSDRILIGPIPAIKDLEYEHFLDEETNTFRYRIVGGEPTWDGQDKEVCEKLINTWGINSFLAEAQHDVDVNKDSTYSGVVFRRVSLNDLPHLRRTVVWVDPAVSDSDDADSMGVSVAGIDEQNIIYFLYSWEQRTNPKRAIRVAIQKALEFDATEVGFETDQGGILWRDEYYAVFKEMVEDGSLSKDFFRPTFKSAKAGSIGSKRHRHNMMRTAYDRGEIIHLLGTHTLLENALKRFPAQKPYDLADASYWSYRSLAGSRGWSRGMAG